MLPPIEGQPSWLNMQIPFGAPRLAACPGDLITGRFVWVDAVSGLVWNTRLNPQQILCFQPSVFASWDVAYIAMGKPYIREGRGVVPIVKGDRWARFVNGALPQQPVYASLVDGSALCGPADNAELTDWITQTGCDCGELAAISTWGVIT